MDQAPLSMGFSKQEYRSGSPFLPYGIFPIQESNPGLLLYRQTLFHWATKASSSQLRVWINTVWVRGNPCLSWDIGLFQPSDSETSAPLGSLCKHIGFQIRTFTICQRPLDHQKGKRVPEKHLFLLYWLCQSLWLCRSQETVENSERDGSTRPPNLPLEKSVCRSGSNS